MELMTSREHRVDVDEDLEVNVRTPATAHDCGSGRHQIRPEPKAPDVMWTAIYRCTVCDATFTMAQSPLGGRVVPHDGTGGER